MRAGIAVAAISVLAFGLTVSPRPASAQQDEPSHVHIGHVMDSFGGAPNGAGLLTTVQDEIQTALDHLELAARDLTNLQWMQQHAEHVMHAADPSRIAQGPGLGYGIAAAAREIAEHVELAANSEGASDNVAAHAAHVAAAARAIADRGEELADLASQVAAASDYTTAEGLIQRMRTLADQIVSGEDLNGDGQIVWGDGEGGLEHVEQHMALMLEGEGID